MRLFFALILMTIFSTLDAQVLEQIKDLSNEIDKIDKLTLEQQIELDTKIMDLQFDGVNELFEEMRDKLYNKEIIDDIGDGPETEEETTPSLADDERDYLIEKATSVSYIQGRYNLTNSNKNGFSLREIAKLFDISNEEIEDNNSKPKLSKLIYERILKIRG